MAFVNNYVPESEITEAELYGPEPYDLNFVLPVPPVLSTDKVRLVPFIPRVHAPAYFDAYPSDFLRFVETCRREKSAFMFAVIDTTRPDPKHPEWEGSLAGMFGLIGTDKTQLVTEISPAIVLPAFQRTHVGSHAVAPVNLPSNNLAKRMGFKFEGVSRWKYVLPWVEGYQKWGKEARAGDAGNGLLGRDCNEWALCWDDWEEGGRELVERAFARVA
ncbi:hypothetical protein PAXINDRAFT_175161 [Paxillus involutus ATCC 200175]|nr:hypothetical protein PAXINDRAFT_175161 [Paxillus involutus ATCC 200175]